jgi:Domain of unknown function (DUF222)
VDLADLAETMDRLIASDPSTCADTESIATLQQQLARFEAFVTEATASFDASGNWMPDGARNAAGWLSARCRLPKAQARRQVRRGRQIRHLREVARAWEDGDIAGAHVDALVALRRSSTEEVLARDECMLVEQARTLRFDSFVRAVSYWEQLADPDGIEEEGHKHTARRDVYLASSFRGMWLGKMALDPISGAVVAGELERLERELFESDWADARAALGRDPTAGELSRTSGQRRADALVEMATRSRTAPADGRRPDPLLSVLVGYETLHGRICELAQGTVVPPGSLLPWLDKAYFERVVFQPDGRVEVSATARLFTGATRRAIELRDRECTHPFCDVSAAACQVDHIVPRVANGPPLRRMVGFSVDSIIGCGTSGPRPTAEESSTLQPSLHPS